MDNRQAAIINVSRSLGISNPVWLAKLIGFETANTYNPQQANPTSSAKGLIQFMDATARGMGYRDSLDLVTRYPDFATQMYGPVMQYLSPYKPFPTEQSLYMAVFYPKYRKESLNQQFPARVQAANPGIRTVGDYVDKVNRRNLPMWWQSDFSINIGPSVETTTGEPWWKWLLGVTVFAVARALLGGRGRKRR